MRVNGQDVYLFNPWQISEWSEEQLSLQVNELIKQYNPDEGAPMYVLAKNVEIVANITYILGEMISRLTQDHGVKKLKCDELEAQRLIEDRSNWERLNPDKKLPAISYFEGKARLSVVKEREEQIIAFAKLTRFKQSYESYENIMNALKKKLESVKYEEFNA